MSIWLLETDIRYLEDASFHSEDGETHDYDTDHSQLKSLNDCDSGSASDTKSDCSSKDFDDDDEEDDDDDDDSSLEMDEEERNKISAQINGDDDEDLEESPDERGKSRDEEDEDDEDYVINEEEKDVDVKEKDQKRWTYISQSTEDDGGAFASHNSLCEDSFEEELHQGQATAGGMDQGDTSSTDVSEGGRSAQDVYRMIQKLDSERLHLVQDLEKDEKQRQWFHAQLKAITHKLESLPHTETLVNGQVSKARRQLEFEAHQVQGAMAEKLGSLEQSALRQEARLERIRTIENEMHNLQTLAKEGTKDASTMTSLTQDSLTLTLDKDGNPGGYVSDCSSSSHSDHHVSIATQTGEVTVLNNEHDGLIAPGIPLSGMYHGAWPIDKAPSSVCGNQPSPPDLASVMSFNSTNTNGSNQGKVTPTALTSSQSSASSSASSSAQPQQLGTKVEMVYSLLSMLGTHDKDDMSRTLFAMSQSQDSCIAMRQSGCLPLLLQLLHGSDKDSGLLGKTRGSKDARARAAAALHNIVHCNTDDKRGRREARTLRLLEQIRAHCDQQRGEDEEEEDCAKRMNDTSTMDHHPGAAIAALMKLSFDEDYRHAICTLGGLQAIAELLEVDSKNVRSSSDYSTTIRRYACMSLTNLTFGDGKNKALLCSMKGPMKALTEQLRSCSEDLIQAAASVLRNLSWRADLASKKTLRELGAVTILMRAAMTVKKETTLKSILSALWNLSSHCSENKAEICAVDGALQFLVGLLSYKSANKTLAIVENGGGILRNVSSQVAIREDYRKILRKHGCLQILLNHLRSTSLTIVSNACGTLWNLSARCEEDQNALREMGAISMLRNLVHSRHKMISSGSSAALRNLLSSMPSGKGADHTDSVGLSSYHPSLHVRKQKALEADLDQNLSETCDNVDSPSNSPSDAIHRSESEPRRFVYHMHSTSGDQTTPQSGPSAHRSGDKKDDDPRKHLTRRPMMPRVGSEGNRNKTKSPQRVPRAGSQDSVGSTHSDISHDRTRAHTMLVKSSHLLHKRQGGSLERKEDCQRHHKAGHSQGVGTPSDNTNIGVPHSGSHTISNGNNYDSVVNVVPAHGWQAHGTVHPSAAMPLHHFQQQQLKQQQQQQQLQQSQPNSLIVQYMQEVAMLAGVEPSAASSSSHSHPASSASLLSLQHQHHHQQQKALLERLAKSSKAITGTNNLNSSMTSSTTSSIDPGCLDPRNLPNLDDGMDQPVNYSLKYKDGVEAPKIPLAHSYPIAYPKSSTHLNYKPSKDYIDSISDNLHYHMNNSDYIRQNESVLNNSSSDGGSVMINPTLHTPPRPVPNLVYNRLHTPQSYLPNKTPAYNHQSGVNWPNSPHHHPSRYIAPHHHPSYAAMSPHNYGQSGIPKNYGFSPMVYDPKSNQKFYHMPAAHQNSTNSISHFNGITSSTYAETDLDSVIDQPTDFSLRYSEVDDNSCRDTYQDQPINYSLRFHGGGEVETQPTSNGTGGMTVSSAAFPNMEELRRYEDERHCVECKYQQEVGDSSNDDQVRTFCTEGTPYLSTATSLSDLRHTGKAEDDEGNVEGGETDKEDSRNDHIRSGPNESSKEGELEEEEGFGFALNSSKNVTVVEAADKTLTQADAPTPVKTDAVNTAGDLAASSSGSQATDRQTGSTVVGLGPHPLSVSRPASQQSETVTEVQTFHADDGNEGALDQTKTYAEEGTPVCFSRVSSLSSLHSSDIRGSNQTTTHGHGVASNKQGDMSCISESNIPQPGMSSVIESRNTLPATNTSAATTPAPKIGSKLRKAHADEGLKGDRETKTVTFDENNQVEETPLMFSRSSSPESLSSFDTQSMHSSVVSEYSRRASEVVSPSEIPDSPSESMPSSPRRTHSPTRRFKEFTSTPKTTNANVKQSLEFIRTPSTVKADPFINFTAFDEEDKPINFASRSQEMGLISPFGAFPSQDQPISMASFGHQDDRSRPVTFTTFQKTVPASITSTQPPSFSAHSMPSAPNRFASPRARPLPTLMEQIQETESISGKSEVPVVYAEEGTPPNFSETTSLSGLTMEDAKGINDGLVLPESVPSLNAMSTKSPVIMSEGPYKLPTTLPADPTQSGMKTSVEVQPMPLSVLNESSSIKVALKPATSSVQMDEPVVDHSKDIVKEAKEGADVLESITNETFITVEEPCVTKGGFTSINAQSLNSTCEEPDLPKLEEKETGSELVQIIKAHETVNPSNPACDENSPQKAASSPAMDLLKQEERESSMSEVSEGEEDILAQCISSAMPTPTSSARKMRRSSSDNVIKKKSGIPTKRGDSSPSKISKTPSSKSSNLPKISPPVSSSASSVPKSSANAKESQTSQISPASKPPRPSSKSSRSSSGHQQDDLTPGSPKLKNSSKLVHPQPTSKSSDIVNKSKQGTNPVPNQHDISSGILSNTSVARNSLRLKHGHVSQAGTGNPASSPAARPDLDKGTKMASVAPVYKNKEVPCNIPPQKFKTPSGKNYVKNVQAKDGHIQAKSGDKTGVQGTGGKDYFDDYNHDTVKSYATEGTPLNFSASTSLSDLSVITSGSNAVSKSTALPDSQARQPSQEDAKSDNSSVCGENEELLLSEMIQSGMPKNKSSRKNGGESAGNEANRPPSRDCNMSAFVPRMSNLNVLPPFHDFIPVDTVKTYNVEGTPKNFSAATSLSDLTIDSVEMGSGICGKGTGAPRKPISQSGTTANNPSNIAVKQPSVGSRPAQVKSSNGPTHPAFTPSYITQGQTNYGVSFTPPSNDSLHTYQVEGTPRSFSRQDSLNSLEVGDDGSRPQHVYCADRDESDSSSSLPKERHVVGQSSEDSSIAGDKGSDRPIKFAIEDTPVTFSRNSSLSSLTSIDNKMDTTEVPNEDNTGTAWVRNEKQELRGATSVDSLSDEGNDCDPTPSEQLLLEQCIYAALPKSRLPRGEESARRHSRAKNFIQCNSPTTRKNGNRSVSKQTPNLTKSASLEIPTESGMLTDSNQSATKGSQSSLKNERGSNNSLMTRSCSDTTELDFDSLSNVRQSRYTAWKRKRHHSQEEIASNDYPDIPNTGGTRLRSHSQECGNDFKMQKDISNKLAQANGRENCSSTSFVRSPGFDSVHESQHAKPDLTGTVRHLNSSSARKNLGFATFGKMEKSDAEKTMSDFAAKVREISNDSMAGLVALKDGDILNQAVLGNSCETKTYTNSKGAVKAQMAGKRDDTEENVLLSEENEYADSPLDTEGDNREEGEGYDDVKQLMGIQDFTPGISSVDCDLVFEETDNADEEENLDKGISPEEEERLLMENIHLVVSELQTTKMSGSTIDEDMFIQNETISLVSNDYNSDTNSEISLTWSDKNSDMSANTMNEARSTASSAHGGSKVVKPTENELCKFPESNDAIGKAIRGRRKPLYPGKSTTQPNNKNNNKLTVPKQNNSPPGAKSTVTSANKAGGFVKKNISPRTGIKVAQVSPRTRQDESPSGTSEGAGRPGLRKGRGQVPKQNTPTMNSANKSGGNSGRGRGIASRSPSVGNRNAGPTPSSTNAKAAIKSVPVSRNGNNKPANNTSPQSNSSPPNNKSKQQIPAAQKSKPLKPNIPNINTNLKLQSAKPSKPKNSELPQENKENKEQITLRDRKNSSSSSSLSTANRLSSGSTGSDGGDGNLNAPSGESWTKALDSFNFIVDSTKDCMAYKHIHMQRNGKDAPESIIRMAKPPNKSESIQDSQSASTGVASQSSSNKTALPKAQIRRGVNQDQKNFSKSPSEDTKQSSVHRSNDSLKGQNRPMTPVSGGSRRSSNSSGSAIPMRKSDSSSSPLSSDSGSKRTPPGPGGKKQVPSKIATLWKRDGSTERSPSRDSLSSPSNSRLPVSMTKNPSGLGGQSPSHNKPSSLPPSGFKTKAATLPAGSSLTATKSKSVGEGISKSSTYEKISTILGPKGSGKNVKKAEQDKAGSPFKNTKAPVKSTKQSVSKNKSPESEIRRGEVFELCDGLDDENYDIDSTEDVSYAANDSLESNVISDSNEVLESTRNTLNSTSESLDSLDESHMGQIDSNTFRKKKRDPSLSEFALPNADETCRSMCSFNESVGASPPVNSLESTLMKIAGIDDSVASEVSISHISNGDVSDMNASGLSKASKKYKLVDEKGGKAKSNFAQGLKRLFGSNKHKDKDKEKVKESSKSKSSKSNTKDKAKKGKDTDNEFCEKLPNLHLNTSLLKEDKSVCSQGTSTSQNHASTQNKTPTAGLRLEHKSSPSAIVAPFNYSPPVNAAPSNPPTSNVVVIDLDSATSFTSSTTSTVIANEEVTESSWSQSASSSSSPDSSDPPSQDSQSSIAPDKPLTKTEMLLARRKKSSIANQTLEKSEKRENETSIVNGMVNSGTAPAGCMVTTV